MIPAEEKTWIFFDFRCSLRIVLWFSVIFTLALTVKSAIDFTHQGPTVSEEILDSFSDYLAYAMGRLSLWTLLLTATLTCVGLYIYAGLNVLIGVRYRVWLAILFALGGFAFVVFLQFADRLLFLPGNIISSFLYRISRLYPLWEVLTPDRVNLAFWGFWGGVVGLGIIAGLKLIFVGRWYAGLGFHSTLACGIGIAVWCNWAPQPEAIPDTVSSQGKPPNILMIGSDTLRADRMGTTGYNRRLTPYLDELAREGYQFNNLYVPIARTAPSLTTLLTGTWPHTHGVRSNFVEDQDRTLPVGGLPKLLQDKGYRTVGIGDWAASDLEKFNFGYDKTVVAPDQWNIKYLIRQGPKDIRLFLSLFLNNRLGQTFLPEVFFLAGVSVHDEMTRQAMHELYDLSQQDQPFFMTLFTANTHLPFSSSYPYYRLYADTRYRGESLFAIGHLLEVQDVVERQSQDENGFDVQQMIDLYDGAVRSFDDQVRRIVRYVRESPIGDNTIIVIFSDHGVDLFERRTWGQGNTLLGDNPSARVPLIIYDPRREGGVSIEQTTRSVDIMPTLLELLSVEEPKDIDGVSLCPYMDGSTEDMALAAFHETALWIVPNLPGMEQDHLTYPSITEVLSVENKDSGTISIKTELRDLILEAKDRMIRTDRWKLAYLPQKDGARWLLFDMQKDPQGTTDVSAQYPKVTADLKKRLINWMQGDASRRWDADQEHLLAR